jgi:hypothetical protein
MRQRHIKDRCRRSTVVRSGALGASKSLTGGQCKVVSETSKSLFSSHVCDANLLMVLALEF